jgi:predicted cupin superfamily sugar epimerase
MTKLTSQQLIEHLGLIPLRGEGGHFREIYRAPEIISKEALPDRYQVDKPMSTAIYYLLTDEEDSFSAVHLLPTDEVYHFYLGDPVEQLYLYPDGSSKKVILGQDLLAGHHVQYVAPANVWQGSRVIPGGKFALMGTTMAPGFTVEDYVGGERDVLIEQYPQEADLIRHLTHPDGHLEMYE